MTVAAESDDPSRGAKAGRRLRTLRAMRTAGSKQHGRTSIRSAAAACAALALACGAMQGCVVGRSGAPRVGKAVTQSTDFSRAAVLEKINADQLDLLTNAYADRYRTLLEDAVNDIIRGGASARQRAIAQRMLVESTTSVYDIATSGDPFSQVLDLTVVVTLTSQVWIDNDRAERAFGRELADPLIDALRQAREEIWEIAGRVFMPDQLAALDFLIDRWRKENRGVDDVYWVRFDDFGEGRGDGLVAEIEGGGGLFEPIGKAIDQAKSYERLLERMFYLAKRGPTLAGWQSQAVIDEVIAKEEVGRALANLDGVTRSVDELSKTAGRLTDEIPELIAREREAVFIEIDRRHEDIDATLGRVQVIVERTAPVVSDVNRLAETSERMLDKVAELVAAGGGSPPDPDAPPPKPFDIADYERVLVEASTTLREANALAEKGESLAGSPALRGLIDEVTAATQERIDSVERAASRLIWQAGLVLAGVVVLAFGLSAAARRAAGPRAAKETVRR